MRAPRWWRSVASALLIVPGVTGCATRTDRIPAKALAELIEADPDHVVVVDVRSGPEWRAPGGHVPGAVHVPYPGVKTVAADRIDASAEDTVVLVCFTGHRSVAALEAVQQALPAKVVDLDGGMLAWWAANLPVQVEDSHAAPPTGDAAR